MKQIKVNVTNARKNLFSLINSVATGNIEVIITKNNVEGNVVLKRENKKAKKSQVAKNLQVVKETAGSLKSLYSYKSEKELKKELKL